jgi:ParB/RepB/Spo0J family partition protein
MSKGEIATNNPTVTEVVEVSLHLIKPSKSNPRKSFEDLGDLANSIRQNGVQQPLLVRPHPSIAGAYDLVAGERRWRASKLAQKQTAPCIVKPLSDEEALDLQMVENIQREDLSPLEAAAGYAKLVKRHGDIATVAAKIGKEVGEITRVLQLNKLTTSAKEALAKGDMLLGHAYELCRLRDHEQKQALDFLFEKGDRSPQVQTRAGWKPVGRRAVPVADLRVWIQNTLMLDLVKAPFDATDASLNPAMGACGSCPHRTGNAPVLFADIKSGDVCTVPACFFAKRNAALERRAQALAKEHGLKSILKIAVGWVGARKDESMPPFDKQVYSNTGVSLVEPGTECEYTKPAMVVYGERSENLKVGQYVSVCTRAGYEGECKKHNGRTRSGHIARPKLSPTVRANRRVENWKKEQPMLVLARIAKETVEAAKKVKISGTLLKQALALCSEEVFDHVYSDRYREVGKAFDLEAAAEKNHSGRDWQAPLEKFTADNPLARLVLTLCAHNFGEHSASKIRAMAKIFKVDVAKISADAEQELKNRVDDERSRACHLEERHKRQRGASNDSPADAGHRKTLR